jgi:uncharacterized protein YfbU (UPF0304 family)
MKRSRKQQALDQGRREQVREEVLEILDMFVRFTEAYESLRDKAGIKDCWIKFDGFDGNTEHEHKLALWEIAGGCPYRNLGDISDRDSRSSNTLRRYRHMVEVWKGSRKPSSLTKEDLVRITNVRLE